MLPDSYLTLGQLYKGEFKDKGSRFLAFAFPVKDEEEAREILKLLRKEHHAAAHVCWAYVLGYDGEFEKSSDDREPSGTAGRPILRTLQEKKLTFVLMAVVRYFGGKLLGVPGLIYAYGTSASMALEHASVVEKKLYHRTFQPCDYTLHHEIIRICKQNQLKFFPDIQSSTPGITFDVCSTDKAKVLESLQSFGFLAPIELAVLID
ncbi:MAG: YigZ family protein [bacterium]|nr:YigZ family protein [bacterium]